ncbi:C40 family peptidase [Nocardia iowensis]|uniref:C40 family peptidase n=1 Tax=Nocardia iowensis TaxID=204891 RepID=A0ABX8RYD6_NOCIO|nr:C40 family peptidase [Nocardia iowensis]QXN94668.1 C40 family peptidase [Nocardia iowensis]
MSAELTDGVQGVLRALVGLYGTGSPVSGQSLALSRDAVGELRTPNGSTAAFYAEARGNHAAVAESQTGRDGLVHKLVAGAADGTMTGRSALTRHIADFQDRLRALAAIPDSRFSGPALLDAARMAVANATKQVNADSESARQRAAQIIPPAPARARRRPPRRLRGRGQPRSISGGKGRRPRRATRPSDGTVGGEAVRAAEKELGTPYVWGGGALMGASLGGFDCSGLTRYAIAQATNGEVVLPRTTYEQIHSGVRVHPQDAQPGDLVFPRDSFSARGPEHVQLAAGGGRVIEAPYTGSYVKYSDMPRNAVVVRVL